MVLSKRTQNTSRTQFHWEVLWGFHVHDTLECVPDGTIISQRSSKTKSDPSGMKV